MLALTQEPVYFSDPNSGKVFWESHPGPQTRALLHLAFEILFGGARGGGKSAALIAWLALGNPRLPDDHPCRWSYLNHPRYRALVLRRDATDLRDFVQEAVAFYRPFGCKKRDDPPELHFPGGPIIYLNHLNSDDAFEKYRGWNLTKLGIEELTQIERESSYLRVIGSLRSPDPEVMVTQVFATTNPDGNGSPWVRKRFVHVMDDRGQIIPWGKTILDPYSGKTRIFIPSKVADNPSVGADYISSLKLQDEKTRRAWIDGDWNALVGLYFSSFRPNGPLTVTNPPEPECARHVIKRGSIPLMGFWPRYIGCDWGFKDNAAALWLCSNQQDERLHVYDELITNQVGAEELGVLIAQRTLPVLLEQPEQQIQLFLSHDAFAVRDVGKTTAELIQRGIEAVVGVGSALLAGAYTDNAYSDQGAVELPALDSDASIVIYKAGRERVSIWQHIRSLLRFWPMIDLGEPDPEYAKKIIESGHPDAYVRYEAYLNSFKRKKEVLPGLVIWDNCVQLIEEMSTAIHDDRKPEDILDVRQDSSHMDALQALRHAIMMLMRRENALPFRHYMAQQMSRALPQYAHDLNIMKQIARKAEENYSKMAPKPTGHFLRSSSRERLAPVHKPRLM